MCRVLRGSRFVAARTTVSVARARAKTLKIMSGCRGDAIGEHRRGATMLVSTYGKDMHGKSGARRKGTHRRNKRGQ